MMPQIPFINNKINPTYINENETMKVKINESLFSFLAEIKCDIDLVQVEWDNIKKYTNHYEFIHTNVPGTKHPVSRLKPLSRSYYKMIEMCKLLNIVDTINDKITSFHFAEGPGGFVEALCYLRKNKNDKYYAMTLQDETNVSVPGWRKSKNFLDNNKNVHIQYGATKDGDLLKKENLLFCYEQFNNSCDIITGDGGFDFSVDFNNQEGMSLNLIFSQIAFAIACQKLGGNFILKVFDTFTETSVDFVYFLSSIYENVFVVKPNTSRSANSEKYIICKHFRLQKQHVKEYVYKFIDILDTFSQHKQISRLFSTQIPILYLTKLEEINAIYGQQQIESILFTLTLIKKIKNNYSEKYKLEKLKTQNIAKCISWCEKYNIPMNRNFNTNNFIHDKNIVL